MLVMKIYMIPKLTEVGAEMAGNLAGGLGIGGGGGGASNPADLSGIFLGTVLIQGVFAGLMIGKFSEGKFQAGIKHSVFMVVVAYLVFSAASGIFLGNDKAALLLLIPTNIFSNFKKWFSIRKV